MEYKLANSKIKEIPNIKLKDRLSTKLHSMTHPPINL